MLAAMFMAGAFLASPELRVYAANTIGSADIINNSIQSVDIKDGEVKTDDIAPSAIGSLRIKDNDVKAQDIAPNGVGTSEIADGTIAYADLSRSLIAVEHRNDCNCGGTGWDPDGTSGTEIIVDNRITINSVVAVTSVGYGISCTTYVGSIPEASGRAVVRCTQAIPQGMGINYAIFSNPAYGS